MMLGDFFTLFKWVGLALHIIIFMPERKAWTPEEDRTLKYLREELQINKWSIIAKKMADEFDMLGRTGKQCR